MAHHTKSNAMIKFLMAPMTMKEAASRISVTYLILPVKMTTERGGMVYLLPTRGSFPSG